MPDDTVQQIVQSVPTSPVNAHPALIERRSRGRRRSSKEKQEGRKKGSSNGQEHGSETPIQLTDTVTLSSRTNDDSEKKEAHGLLRISHVPGETGALYPAKVPVKIPSKVRTGTIDIRI